MQWVTGVMNNKNDNKNDNKTDFTTVWRMQAGDPFDMVKAIYWTPGTVLIIDYGDGCIDKVSNRKGLKPHVYRRAGDYEVRISNNITAFKPPSFYGLSIANTVDTKKLIEVKQWGDAQWTMVNEMFYKCTNMTMSATDEPNLSKISETRNMFAHCRKFNSPINHWDMSNIHYVGYMLYDTSAFNQDLSNWAELSNLGERRKTYSNTSFETSPCQIFGHEQTIDHYMEKYKTNLAKGELLDILNL